MWKFFNNSGSEKVTPTLWETGDYKISAKTATHADPSGGTWYLCDGSATVGAALIALVGATLPDTPGRGLVMKGTHADVNAIGDSDGVALASRRPTHKHIHALTLPNHTHTEESTNEDYSFAAGGTSGRRLQTTRQTSNPSTLPAINGTVGPQSGSEPTDTPAYVVPGSLFIHS